MASIRLNKIIKQYNIGLEKLVEFLTTQGLVVEPNPNAKISEEYLPAIHDHFGNELEHAKAAHEYFEKIKAESSNTSFLSHLVQNESFEENTTEPASSSKLNLSDQFDWGLFNQEEDSSGKKKESAKEENPLVNLTMNQKKVILQRIANSLNMDVIVSLKEKKK